MIRATFLLVLVTLATMTTACSSPLAPSTPCAVGYTRNDAAVVNGVRASVCEPAR